MSLREYGKFQSHVKYFCLGGYRGYFDHIGFLKHSRLPPEFFACVKLGNDYVLFEKVTGDTVVSRKKMEYFRHLDDNKAAGWRCYVFLLLFLFCFFTLYCHWFGFFHSVKLQKGCVERKMQKSQFWVNSPFNKPGWV